MYSVLLAALENTQDTITNICFECGFESQRTFNRVFKERYKISPSDYRNTFVNRAFLMKKREENPKRNLEKGLTKPKIRHQRSVKKRKRDLKSEQKKRRGAERLSEKRIKKDSLLQPDYLDILWIKPSRF